MLSIISIFVASCLVSFLGSIQLGPVNLFVINSVLFDSKKSAFYVALGGSLPEFIYCALAVYANTFLSQSDTFQFIFKIIFIVVLICIGCFYLFKKSVKMDLSIAAPPYTKEKSVKYFIKGFSLATLNPQLLPFWMFVQVYFNSIQMLQIKSQFHNLAFVLGSGIGAFLLLTLLIIGVHKYKKAILRYINNKYYFKALSLLFFAIAIQQLILLIK